MKHHQTAAASSLPDCMAVLTRILNGWLPDGCHISEGVCSRIIPVPLQLNSAHITLLAKMKTWEETTNSLKISSEGTCLTLKGTRYGASRESWRFGPTRCQYNQLLTGNLSLSTLQQVLYYLEKCQRRGSALSHILSDSCYARGNCQVIINST